MIGAKEKFLALQRLRQKQNEEKISFADQLKLDVMVFIENYLKAIPLPENGKDYVLTETDKSEIASRVTVPVVEKQIVVEKTEVIREQPIITEVTKVTNEIKEVALHETPIETANKLNTLTEKVEKKVIIGLEDELEKIRKEVTRGKKNPRLGGGGGSGTRVPVLLSGSVDGSNQSFTFDVAPRLLCVDGGRTIAATSSDGTVNWTGTTSITLAIAPVFDLIPIA